MTLLVAAGLLIIALFAPWLEASTTNLVLFGAIDRVGGFFNALTAQLTGWQRWSALDIALAALAAGLVVAAWRRPPRAVRIALVAVAALCAACVVVAGLGDKTALPRDLPGFEPFVDVRESITLGPSNGPWIALAGLVLAIGALARSGPRRIDLDRRGVLLAVLGTTVALSPFVNWVTIWELGLDPFGDAGFDAFVLLDWADTALVLGGAAIALTAVLPRWKLLALIPPAIAGLVLLDGVAPGIGSVGAGGVLAGAALLAALVALAWPQRATTTL
jgi:hypothetical protein